MERLTAEQLRWYRQRRSGLVEPFGSPEAAAAALVGVQAQILSAAALALWNRTEGLSYAALDGRLHEARTLVKLWGQRHTLHLYPSAEWPLIYAALARSQTWWEKRIAQQGGDVAAYQRLVGQAEQLLRERETLGRSDLRASTLPLEAWHLSSWGGLFADLVRRGHACHAGQRGNEGRFAHRTRWLPDLPWEPPSQHDANVEIARRFLHCYGPATPHDLAYWRGATVSQARQWLAALGDEVVEVDADGQPMLALRVDVAALHAAPPAREAWPVRLLYRFDPLLLALKDKAWVVPPDHYGAVWRPAGHIEGVILEHGRAIGTWRYDRQGGGLVITLRPFAPLPAHSRPALEQHAAGIAAFFDLPLNHIQAEA